MVVQHNLIAMNSNRMLGLTVQSQSKSTEKLSSGYKINRAADDAAGLSISEKMRKQIRGLTQASLNAADGISAVQTAEGALNEVQDMLQRANELAVKAATGTMSEDDRSYIQDEIDQLMTEIDRVSTTTKFNETYLLQGTAHGTAIAQTTVTGDANLSGVDGITLTLAKGAEVKAGTIDIGTVGAQVKAGATGVTGASLDEANLSGVLKDELNAGDKAEIVVAKVANSDNWTIDGAGTYTVDDLKGMGLNVSGATNAAAASITVEKTWTQTESKELQAGLSITGTADLTKAAVGTEVKATLTVTPSTVEGEPNEAAVTKYDSTYVPEALRFSLHVGADSSYDNKIALEIASMSAAGLGLLDANGKLLVDGLDSTNADKAIDTIATAIQRISTQRSALGAIQNRLEHTINNLDNVVENTTAAESQIRDTDMATEMVKYSNNNILAQAGQAMLAQSNQANQGVLSLLG